MNHPHNKQCNSFWKLYYCPHQSRFHSVYCGHTRTCSTTLSSVLVSFPDLCVFSQGPQNNHHLSLAKSQNSLQKTTWKRSAKYSLTQMGLNWREYYNFLAGILFLLFQKLLYYYCSLTTCHEYNLRCLRGGHTTVAQTLCNIILKCRRIWFL